MTARASFTADEVAQMHGVSASKIRKMVANGDLARVPHLGRTVRIPYAEVVDKFGELPAHMFTADELRERDERIMVATLEQIVKNWGVAYAVNLDYVREQATA